jgi:hypothetical protein
MNGSLASSGFTAGGERFAEQARMRSRNSAVAATV